MDVSGTHVAVVVARVADRPLGRRRRVPGDTAEAAARAAVRETGRRVRRDRMPVIMTISAAALADEL